MVGRIRKDRLELTCALVRAGPDHQRQVGHIVDLDAVEDDSIEIDQSKALAVLPQRPPEVRAADVDHQSVRKAPGAGVLGEHPGRGADLGSGSRRPGAGPAWSARWQPRSGELVNDDCIDQLAVHLLDADDLIAVDAETDRLPTASPAES